MPDIATLSARFQITIPKRLRDLKQWRAGQTFACLPKGDGLWLVPVPARADLVGLARGASEADSRDRSDRV